jgi:hypothetical protein
MHAQGEFDALVQVLPPTCACHSALTTDIPGAMHPVLVHGA